VKGSKSVRDRVGCENLTSAASCGGRDMQAFRGQTRGAPHPRRVVAFRLPLPTHAS